MRNKIGEAEQRVELRWSRVRRERVVGVGCASSYSHRHYIVVCRDEAIHAAIAVNLG